MLFIWQKIPLSGNNSSGINSLRVIYYWNVKAFEPYTNLSTTKSNFYLDPTLKGVSSQILGGSSYISSNNFLKGFSCREYLQMLQRGHLAI